MERLNVVIRTVKQAISANDSKYDLHVAIVDLQRERRVASQLRAARGGNQWHDRRSADALQGDSGNATLGFEQLAKLTDVPSKSLHRRLSPKGNPSMDNLAAIFGAVSSRILRSTRTTRQREVA